MTTIDGLIVRADMAAASLRARTAPTPIVPVRPRAARARHRMDRIALSPLEFMVMGTANALLGGILVYAGILISAGWR